MRCILLDNALFVEYCDAAGSTPLCKEQRLRTIAAVAQKSA